MRFAIDLDAKLGFGAVEVEPVGACRMFAAKIVTARLLAQLQP